MRKLFVFGAASLARLNTCHPDLIVLAKLVISRSKIDFGITEGHRSLERQKLLFDQGKSRIDGINRKGEHNYDPSLALDFYIYLPDLATRRRLAYDTNHLCYVAGLFDSCAQELYEAGKISHIVRWGDNWDQDGVIAYDQSFDDMPHIELFKPR